MRRHIMGTLTLLLVATTIQSTLVSPASVDYPASSTQIRTAMILWGGSASGLVETITPASLDGRRVWRVTHYSQDPTTSNTNDYDLYDLDEQTLAPIRSVRNTEEYRLELAFGPKEVSLRKITAKNTTVERIPISQGLQAEGPGLDVFVAGLPLQQRYKIRYVMIDRWDGHDSSRVKVVTLSVVQKATEDTSLGRREIYKILIQPEDDSFQIKENVIAETPHYPVRVEYTRAGKTYPASDVISLVSRP